MRTTTFLLMTLASLPGCQQQQGPTAKEIFELRGQCGALAEKEGDKESEPMLVKANGGLPMIHSHYDPKTSKCLLRVMYLSMPASENSNLLLMDAQSRTVLANCFKVSDLPESCMIGDKDKSDKEVWAYIDSMMGEDK